MRVLLMGTGEFALPAFKQLMESAHDVVGLVTQPDRVGKGHHQHANPLKELAISRQIPVFQPDKVNTPESLDRLREFQADLFVVAAYGQILSANLLSIPQRGAINLHGSILPKYRGAAPIQYSVWKGELETGVTIFQIEPKLDAGPILGVFKTPIGAKETSGQLHDRLAQLSAPFTLQVLNEMEQGTVAHAVQPVEGVTKAPRLKKEEGLVDWSLPSRELGWHIRAMQPWPMPYSFLNVPGRKQQRVLILDVDPVPASEELPTTLQPGEIQVKNGEILVRIGSESAPEWVRVNTIQPAGKRAMNAADFLRGTDLTGASLGAEIPV
ncbi:methionyl-tRNA formyltransferase [Planctomicrobium sp. SH527]|uniref:methionyl-tRNA formyltransferase n=1 Tax=Planctomicrobium sp. SH527 TaxID=3448123 RepID=UPI003F5B2201